MEQCQTLNEYAQYVEKVRTYTKEDNLDNAVERAVNECIRDGILADFLAQNKSEVIAMSIFEYDEKAVRQVYYEDGLKAGIRTGILNMLKAKKYSLEEISEVFQVPVEEIEQKTTNIISLLTNPHPGFILRNNKIFITLNR